MKITKKYLRQIIQEELQKEDLKGIASKVAGFFKGKKTQPSQQAAQQQNTQTPQKPEPKKPLGPPKKQPLPKLEKFPKVQGVFVSTEFYSPVVKRIINGSEETVPSDEIALIFGKSNLFDLAMQKQEAAGYESMIDQSAFLQYYLKKDGEEVAREYAKRIGAPFGKMQNGKFRTME